MVSANIDTCKVCGKQHSPFVCLANAALSMAIRLENGERETKLRAKCQWEHMTRSSVLAVYGDPANW